MLTPRQKEVLELTASGLVLKQVALALHVSHATVKNHLVAIRERLEANTTNHAIAIAIREGLIE